MGDGESVHLNNITNLAVKLIMIGMVKMKTSSGLDFMYLGLGFIIYLPAVMIKIF